MRIIFSTNRTSGSVISSVDGMPHHEQNAAHILKLANDNPAQTVAHSVTYTPTHMRDIYTVTG